MDGLKDMIELHEYLLNRKLTYYEYRLVRSVYFSTLAQIYTTKLSKLESD